MQKIAPCLWFDGQAEEAANFYVSTFQRACLGNIKRYGEAGPGPSGSVMSVEFQLEGTDFIALNGGPMFKFSPAISFLVSCQTQEELDAFWKQFTAGGEVHQCGWVTDRFGVTWQIVPQVLGEMLDDPDPARTARVMQAMMQMKQLDIAGLQAAYAAP